MLKKSVAFWTILAAIALACSNTPLSSQVIHAAMPQALAATPGIAPGSTQGVSYVAGSTQKVCQVTGNQDRQTNQPTLNQTQARYGISGTDLGFSFEQGGKIYFLFGDTNGNGKGKFPGADSLAYSSDTQPNPCLNLQFPHDAKGVWLPPIVPGIAQGPYDVPTGGFEAGDKMYVFFVTDHLPKPPPQNLGRSVLAQSSDGGQHFTQLYTASQSKFVEIYPLVVDNASIPGLPEQQGQGVLLWGAGQYRQSDPYLAYVPLDKISDRNAWQFFAGLQDGSPRWSPNEADATALFDQACLGEFSVQHNSFLNKWLLLYSCDQPRGINFRVSNTPWGDWSATQLLFDPKRDPGYCAFVHMSFTIKHCDAVSDPGRENVSGGEYAPALISRFTTGDATQTTIYFLMSTWNPYEVVLMKATLKVG